MHDFICGANAEDFHFTGVNWGRDLPEPDLVADMRNVVAGDPSPDGKGQLAIQRGIEVGHVFYLGTKYSQAMNATYLDDAGKPQLMEMGCYGIGVTRILGAAIEQNHDERGIVWPDAIAPFSVVRLPDRLRAQCRRARRRRQHCTTNCGGEGVDVLLDDRGERPGAMFADWELIGVPHRVVISERGLKEGKVEYQDRRDSAAPKPAPEPLAPSHCPSGGMNGGSRQCCGQLRRRRLPWRDRRQRLGLGCTPAAMAGAQRKNRCIDSVRDRTEQCRCQRAPPVSGVHRHRRPALAYLRWLGAMSERLKKPRTDSRARESSSCKPSGTRASAPASDVALVLGLIQVESNFRSTPSAAGAPWLHAGHAVLDAHHRRRAMPPTVFRMQTNLRFGCVILRHYLDIEKGDLYVALGRYNGSRGRAAYPNAVFANRATGCSKVHRRHQRPRPWPARAADLLQPPRSPSQPAAPRPRCARSATRAPRCRRPFRRCSSAGDRRRPAAAGRRCHPFRSPHTCCADAPIEGRLAHHQQQRPALLQHHVGGARQQVVAQPMRHRRQGLHRTGREGASATGGFRTRPSAASSRSFSRARRTRPKTATRCAASRSSTSGSARWASKWVG